MGTDKHSFDEILALVGDKDRYQKGLLFVYYSFYSLITPWIVLVPIFLTTVPDHWCHVDGRPENVTLEEWKEWNIPRETKEGVERFSQCQQYKTFEGHPILKREEREVVDCQNGWDYDRTWYDETLSSKNDWVCENKYENAAWVSVGLSGQIVGILIANRISDIYGRKIVSFFLLQMYGVCSLLRLYFSRGWLSYLLIFVTLIPFPACIQIGLVYVTEQIHNSWRPVANSIFFFLWMSGMSLLPLIAWLSRSWVWLTVATSVPFFFFLLAWPLLEESSRWQASHGKTAQAFFSLTKIADRNGKTLPENFEKTLQNFIEAKKKDNNQGGFLEIFKSRTLSKLAMLLTICWICNMMVYSSLNYNVHNLGGNQFLNFFLLSVAEGPSTLIAWATCQTIGRRFSQVFFFAMVIITTVCPIFFASTQEVETMVFAIISKIMIDASFYAFFLQMIEIYPTSHRTSLMGLSNVVAQSFNVASPYIAYSNAYWSRLPYLIMACLGTLGFIVSSFIPETVMNDLPQTASDSEAFYSNQPFFSYLGRKPSEWKRHLFPFCYSGKENRES